MDTPLTPPDPDKILAIWMEWERGEAGEPGKLISGYPSVAPLVRGLVHPDCTDPVVETVAEASIALYTPCGQRQDTGVLAELSADRPSLRLEPACADLGVPIR